MAKTALKPETDSGKPERKCAWCGAAFSHGNAARQLCSNRCKKASYNHRNREAVNAKQRERNRTEAAKEATKRYLEKRYAAARLVRRAIRAAKAEEAMRRHLELWHSRQCPCCDVTFDSAQPGQRYCGARCKSVMRARAKRFKNPNLDKEWRLKNLDQVRQRNRERWRRRAAEQALALLIMPIEETRQ